MRMIVVISAILATIAATASAQEIMAPDDTFVSQKTRAEVLAEVVTAQSQGLMQQQGEITWAAPVTNVTGHTVATLRSEGRHAEGANQFNTVYGPRYRN